MSLQIISSQTPTVTTGKIGFAKTSKGVLRKTPATDTAKISSYGETRTRLLALQDLYTLIDTHGYLRAAIALIGRSAVGAWWDIVPDKNYSGREKELHRKKLYRFYAEPAGTWNNINDYYNMGYKIVAGAMYLKLFGQVAFHIVRNTKGEAVSMDHIPGFMVPNVDQFGNFQSPAFRAYPVNGKGSPVEYENAKDVVYIINPDFAGSPMGSSDLVALADFTFPIDIYLQLLARSYLQNNTRPELIYQLPAEISPESFQDFVEEVTTRWRGPSNAGRSPIVVQGDFKVHKIGDLPTDLPYNESRRSTREEEFAVTGVSGPKVGLVEDMTASGMAEARREFHESVMEPLFRIMEEGLYWQVNVREFGYRDYRFAFNSPDFLTALERATLNMRYYQANSVTPNEIRATISKPPRKDETGDMFLDQLKERSSEIDYDPVEPQGSPPEGREEEPDDGDPTEDSPAPERGDNHDRRTRTDALISEAHTWKRFAKNRFGNPGSRDFVPDMFDELSAKEIQKQLDRANTKQEIDDIFTRIIQVLREDEYE